MNNSQENNNSLMEFGTRDIKITNAVIALHTLIEKISLSEIAVHPKNLTDYNWGEEQMSRLIESILLKIPMPVFYFDVSNPNKWLLINAYQKLRTLKRFMKNEFNLKNMEILTELKGLKYDSLANNYKRIIYDTQIITYQVEAQTPENLREFIFKRIRDMNEY